MNIFHFQPENYEKSEEPVENKTSYNQSYVGHSGFPDIKMTRPGTKHKTRLVSAKFDSRTTNKETFKDWVPEPAISFTDLPSFAGMFGLVFLLHLCCQLQS